MSGEHEEHEEDVVGLFSQVDEDDDAAVDDYLNESNDEEDEETDVLPQGAEGESEAKDGSVESVESTEEDLNGSSDEKDEEAEVEPQAVEVGSEAKDGNLEFAEATSIVDHMINGLHHTRNMLADIVRRLSSIPGLRDFTKRVEHVFSRFPNLVRRKLL